MPRINLGRHTIDSDREITVFLIGMGINSPLRVDRWWPVFTAMPRMLKHLETDPGSGMLGYDLWALPSPLVLMYWESSEQLQAFAADADAPHLQAWRDFAQLTKDGHVGVWHETYVTTPGRREAIYVNMPSLGLGKAIGTTPVGRGSSTARQRMSVTVSS
ncbi:DUF4188 domain-containing protein [Arsenicicoccus cauae]|uniref:DUF4188 domain-containing protein n=1 Tax=Arsenicicoccus cauae TaxID=2663847 RepID=A0A6I3IT61_9MICO|nr:MULTISPECIES: DUF4188 domain-containing protein [Arsenicicoccus]MTB73100.1 DUF4188 domain-containing protein [Arsenicicoccus cauae]